MAFKELKKSSNKKRKYLPITKSPTTTQKTIASTMKDTIIMDHEDHFQRRTHRPSPPSQALTSSSPLSVTCSNFHDRKATSLSSFQNTMAL
jgi:hypothetical protein